MTVTRIGNFDELTNALDSLNNLSDEIMKTFSKTQSIYDNQSSGWYSRNSSNESDKMINYSEVSKSIAKNMHVVGNLIEQYKEKNKNIDEFS